MTNETLAYASLLAFGTTLVTCWNYVKIAVTRISTFLFVIAKISNNGYGVNAFHFHLSRNFRKSPFGIRTFSGMMEFVRPKDKRMLVASEMIAGGNIFWRGWKPIWVSSPTGKDDSMGGGSPNGNGGGLTVTFLRGTYDIEELMCAAVDSYNDRFPYDNDGPTGRFRINYVFGRRNKDEKKSNGDPMAMDEGSSGLKTAPGGDDTASRPLKWKREEIGPPLLPHLRPTEMMILSPDVQEAVDEAIFWKQSQQWYKQREIPWKRGWLLWGRPGTGKTSLARAVAQELDMPVWVFDLASLTNEELRDGWRRMASSAPCIALLEDIDGTFDGRKNVAVEGKQREGLTFDALLNCIDGVERCDGVLVIVTTNKLEKVDPAIGIPEKDGSSSRPGRIDRVIEMKPPDKEGLRRVAKRILDKREDLWDQMAEEAFAKNETVCQFQEKCARIALKQKWENFKLRRLRKDFKKQPAIHRDRDIRLVQDQLAQVSNSPLPMETYR